MTGELVTCPCGDEFLPAYRGQEYCSTECRKSGTKKPPRSYSRPAGFEDPQRTCRVTGCTERVTHQHHVMYRQHLEWEGGDVKDARDALGVCNSHHDRHHKGKRRIKISELRPENVEFIIEVYGGSREKATDYLTRYYDPLP